ncbi:MAG: hypothetical protein II007_07750 [Gammaproteobacteria bacterium]|nr:hypothetical protein [Gammaproteobacteria bacterium]
MQNVKQMVHDIADHLPEMATIDDAIYALYIRQKLEKGLSDLDEGRSYSQEEVEQRLLGKPA